MEKFIRYSSLENHTKTGFLNKIIDQGLSSQLFLATEKIHGSNFSFWVDKDDVRTGKRSGFDSEFACAPKLLEKYREAVELIRIDLWMKGYVAMEDTVVVFGEVFGGKYYGSKEANAKTVQGGMHYHPDTEFMAYDIGLVKAGSQEILFLSGKKFLEVMDGSYLKICPIIAIGTLDEVLQNPNKFSTKVPESFKLALPEGVQEHCIAEGYVVRGYLEDYRIGDSRVVIKSKNSLFAEKGEKADKVVKLDSLSEEHQELLEEMATMLTSSRLESVFSKEYTIEQLNWKMIGELAGKLSQDVLVDFEKEQEDNNEETFGESYRVVKKFLNTRALNTVRDYFKTIL